MIEIARTNGMRMQFDAAEIYYPRKPGRVVHDDFFRGAAGWK
jgi:hypothetical protein